MLYVGHYCGGHTERPQSCSQQPGDDIDPARKLSTQRDRGVTGFPDH